MIRIFNPLFTKEQIVEKVNETNADLMFALDQFWGIMSGIKDKLCVKKIVVIKIEQSMPPFVKLFAHHKLNKKIAYTDRIVPVWFSTGMVFCLLMPLCLGMTVIIEPVFSEENFTKAIYKYKPNLVMGATSLWLNFLETVKKKPMDLSL